jgi:hypothetical protein
MSALISKLIDNIKNNTEVNIGVSAVMLHGTTPVGKICGNSARNYCRKRVCPSTHAELSAITNYLGKYLQYTPKHGWKTWYIKKTKKSKYNGG